MIFAGEKGFSTLAQDKMCELSEKVTFMLMSDLSRWNLVLIISLVRNHGDIVLFNSSGSVSFQGISSTQINDLLILVSSCNFHKNLIVQSSDIFSWMNFGLKQQSLRSAMLNFRFFKKHYFERVDILFFRIDPLNYIFGMVSNGISLFFKKLATLPHVFPDLYRRG